MGTSVYMSTIFVTPLRMRTFQSSRIMSRTARWLLTRSPRPLRLPRAKWWYCHGCSGIMRKNTRDTYATSALHCRLKDAITAFLRA